MKLAVIDLDGVVADSTVRFEQAKARADEQYPGLGMRDRPYSSVYWRYALNSKHVHLDTQIDGCVGHITTLEKAGWTVVFLTSRPEHMRAATVNWLRPYGLAFFPLYCKPEEKQFVKTTVWKGETAHAIAVSYGAKHLLFVDDEPANSEAVLNASPDVEMYRTTVCGSLLMASEQAKQG